MNTTVPLMAFTDDHTVYSIGACEHINSHSKTITSHSCLRIPYRAGINWYLTSEYYQYTGLHIYKFTAVSAFDGDMNALKAVFIEGMPSNIVRATTQTRI